MPYAYGIHIHLDSTHLHMYALHALLYFCNAHAPRTHMQRTHYLMCVRALALPLLATALLARVARNAVLGWHSERSTASASYHVHMVGLAVLLGLAALHACMVMSEWGMHGWTYAAAGRRRCYELERLCTMQAC